MSPPSLPEPELDPEPTEAEPVVEAAQETKQRKERKEKKHRIRPEPVIVEPEIPHNKTVDSWDVASPAGNFRGPAVGVGEEGIQDKYDRMKADSGSRFEKRLSML